MNKAQETNYDVLAKEAIELAQAEGLPTESFDEARGLIYLRMRRSTQNTLDNTKVSTTSAQRIEA